MLCYSPTVTAIAFHIYHVFCHTSSLHSYIIYAFICWAKISKRLCWLFISNSICLFMYDNKKREGMRSLTREKKNLLTNAWYIIMCFLTERNSKDTRTTWVGMSERLIWALFHGLLIISLCSCNVNNTEVCYDELEVKKK